MCASQVVAVYFDMASLFCSIGILNDVQLSPLRQKCWTYVEFYRASRENL